MVWVKMSVALNVVKKRKKTDSKPQSQANKCLNEKRRREQENIYIEELAELISASTSDMSSLSVKPDKCAILQETVNQIRLDKHKPELANDLQQSEVSSSKPTILANDIYGPLLLEALDGFLFVVNLDGKIEFVSENIVSFLKYSQEEIVEKSIYNIIHANDRVRFSNNLLPMSLGNGRDWPTENNPSSNSASKTRSFNCRFLIKPSEDQETSMENKQSSVPQYENMQVSSVLFPFNNDSNEADANKDQQNRLACVARRIPSNEKSPTSLGVEQFTTRLDHTGKIMDIDTSGVSSTYSQYINKEFVGSMMIDFCHSSDLNKLKQHLTETLESGCNTSAVYKLQVGVDRYVRVQTKSKKFNSTQSANEQVIVSTHSIIRDSDSPGPSLLENSQRNEPSTSGQTSASTNMPVTSTSVNGSTGISSLTLPTSYGNFSVLSPNDSDLAFNDYMMDMFPGSTWTLDQNSSHSKDSDNMAATGFIANSPQGGPASNRSDLGSGTRTVNSAFSPGRSVSSPTVPGRAPTPYGNNMSCFSPSAQQQMGGKTSPSAMPVKTDVLCSSSPDTVGINSLSQNIKQERQFKSNQKLRNLLTQNVDDSNSRLNSRTATQDEVTILNESRAFEVMPRLGRANSRDNNCISQIPRSSNVILRDLLNQDDDDSEAPVEPIVRNVDVNMTNTLTPPLCKMNEQGGQQRPNNNNMLRKLLNNDDVDRNYRKSQDLIHQLLIAGSADKGPSFQNEKMKSENIPSPRLSDSPVSKQTSMNSNRMMCDISYLSESGATKRKSLDKNLPNSSNKRQVVGGSNHAHLAGQNPMLASMLAQTPRTPPSVPTSVASTIMTQLPQERLPENLEKKIVHTPYTVTSVSGTSTSTQAVSPVHQDVVTSDSRGHVMHHPQLGLQSGLNNNKYGYSQPQQGFFDKIFNTDDNILIARSLALNLSTIQTSTQNSQVFAQHLTQNTVESSASSNIVDILSDAALADPVSIQTSQANDPSFAEILEQIYSLQEDLNVEANVGTDDRGNILKILGDVIEPSQINAVPRPIATTQVSAHELSEKIAISAIQKQLMSFEGSSLTVASRTGPAHNSVMVPTYSQAGRPSTQVSGTPVVQTQLTQEQLTMLQQQQQLAAPPNYNSSLVTNRVKLPVTNAYIPNNQDLIAQAQRRGLQIVRNTYSGIGNANVNQIRKSIMEKKKYLQQQQKRLLEQQQKQHLSMQTQQPLDVINSSGTPSFPENMNELLNNSVAPNVTLLRSSNVQDVQNNARFALANPLPSPVAQTSTPSQLSPGQRGNPQSPFSPLSQQPFSSQTPPPSTYQQARLSPHPPPSYPQGGPSLSPPIPPTGSPLMGLSPQSSAGSPQWNQRPVASPIPNNLQLQNPMLNAQLSQQASASANQIRLSAQQRQQLALRSLPSPTSVQSSRNSAFSNNADPNYSPLSPITVLQNQSRAQQQRIQRTLSGPGRLTINAQNQSNLASNEALLSPQSLPSPKYAQSVASTAVSSFVSLPSPGGGLTYSLAQDGQFNFDRQNIQTFTSNANDSLRSSTHIQASDFIRQEIRAVVARNQSQSVSSNLDQQTLSMLQSTSGSQGTISDNQETLHDLGLSVQELITVNEAQQNLYSQALLNATSSLENSSQQPSAASSRVEEPKPDQKKSLLQQLLSEPT